MIDPIRGSIWKSNINTWLGLTLVFVWGLWAAITIVRVADHANAATSNFIPAVEVQI
jgi:hypothetical protein